MKIKHVEKVPTYFGGIWVLRKRKHGFIYKTFLGIENGLLLEVSYIKQNTIVVFLE